MVCKNCGNELPATATVCLKCGRSVKREDRDVNYQTNPIESSAAMPYNVEAYMSIGEWVLTTALVLLPGIGIIIAIAYACIKKPRNRKNFATAYLMILIVVAAIIAALYFFAPGVLKGAFDFVWKLLEPVYSNLK